MIHYRTWASESSLIFSLFLVESWIQSSVQNRREQFVNRRQWVFRTIVSTLVTSTFLSTTSTSPQFTTIIACTIEFHTQTSSLTLQEHPVHQTHLQAFPVDKLRHQGSLWRENLQSDGNPRTTTSTDFVIQIFVHHFFFLLDKCAFEFPLVNNASTCVYRFSAYHDGHQAMLQIFLHFKSGILSICQ